MHLSSLVDRVGGPAVRAWDLHYTALGAQRRGEDVILLSVGDPDFDTPPGIVQRAVAALEAGDTHYTDVIGRAELRAAVAQEHARCSGQAVGAEHVAILAGAQNALFAASLCIAEREHGRIRQVHGLGGATVVPVECPAARGFHLDAQRIARAITPRTRAICYASPNNPTGAVCSRAELEGVAALAREHDLWVVADEVYARVCFEAVHQSIAALPGMAERTITVSSVSKSYAMTGWRAGWMVAPPALIAHVQDLAMCMLYGIPGFVQQAVLEALTNGAADVARMRDAYRRRRDLALGILGAVPGLKCLTPEAGMFMLIDVRGTGLTVEEFTHGLYAATGVSTLDAAAFGPKLAGYVRLSFAVGEARLRDACERIHRFLTQRAP
jgi:arginine:pyruvate transaminase